MSPAILRGGIDLGGTKIQTVIVDEGNEVLGEARHPTPHEGGPPAVAEAMIAALREAADAAGAETDQLAGVGVGSPGSIDPDTGAVSNAGNLPDWSERYELGRHLSESLGTMVAVRNDVQVATSGEFELGAGKDYASILGVFWGTGVGGGLILEGEDWLGRGSAGEIGHVVVKRGGRRCPCGNKGCMEAYAGRAAMEARARHLHYEKGHDTKLFHLMKEHDRDRLTSGIWERAVEHEDEMAIELLDAAVKAIGAAVASAVNLLDVEAVVLGGGLGIRFADRYGSEIEKRMTKNLFNEEGPPAFHPAALGDLGGAIGAALLARR